MLDSKRVEAGLPKLEDAGRMPHYIETAADATHKLGVNDPQRIRLIEVDGGTAMSSESNQETGTDPGYSHDTARRDARTAAVGRRSGGSYGRGCLAERAQYSPRPGSRRTGATRSSHCSRFATAADHSYSGREPRALVQKALENLGGIRRFVSRQDVVVIKPNIAWDRTPDQAATTNPDVVAEMVRQCWQAGAKRVVVTDVSCNEPRRCFLRSGIQAAARAEGAEVILPDPELFQEVDIGGVVLKSWPIFKPFLEADKVSTCP